MKLEDRTINIIQMIKSFRDLAVYQNSYQLMLDVAKVIKKLPKEEKFTLVDQMRRASRSIPSNIAEGYAKRHYIAEFKKHLITAVGESNEMEVHLDTAKDLKLLPEEECKNLLDRYHNVGGKLSNLIKNWKRY